MKRMLHKLKALGTILFLLSLAACGSGDEYEGFDAEVTESTPNRFLLYFDQQDGDLDSNDYTNAYYAAIDPQNRRTTLQDYIALHGLQNPDVHSIFRDSKDLGYGRDMYMRSYANLAPPVGCGGQTIAFYVRNFSVQIVEGFAYGPVNLEAAIAEDLQHHIGTNAIEFGLGRKDIGDTCSAEPMAKFYTFEPVYDPAGAPHPRRTRVDLDGRGAKAMPQPCVICHGGTLRPLDRNGDLVAVHAEDPAIQIGDTKSRLQAFEVNTFEFSDQPPYRRVDVEDKLRLLNAAIYCSYPGSVGHAACAPHGGGIAAQANPGEWSGDFAREMLLGWYGNALDTPGASFDGSFVPVDWTPSVGGPPVGADVLFTKVVGPNCFVCHGKQGSELSSQGSSGGKDVDFASWDKFISYADDIERLVYDEGRMPLGLLNFQNFWGDPEKAELLASFIAPYVSDPGGFQARRTDSSGNIIQPGRSVARAGLDRVTSPLDPITLDAGSSHFADTYTWQLIASPTGSVATLSNPSARVTDFSADLDGTYRLRLTASSSQSGSSDSDTLDVVVDTSLPTAPRSLAFYSDVEGVLTTNCTGCHSNGGGGSVPGIPVWWTGDGSQPFPVPPPGIPTGTPSLGLYEQAMTRVNREDIENSLLLRKPSGQHHNGGQVAVTGGGFNISLAAGASGRATYDLFVNWISEGAVCGGTAPQCPP